jgi:hypothetical protein
VGQTHEKLHPMGLNSMKRKLEEEKRNEEKYNISTSFQCT